MDQVSQTLMDVTSAGGGFLIVKVCGKLMRHGLSNVLVRTTWIEKSLVGTFAGVKRSVLGLKS